MANSPYLRLRRVIKSYDGRTNAVDDVSLDISKGEFVTFLGPSGSGKTSTLMLIAGFEEPTAGGIELDGEDLTRSKPYRRNIGMVFQSYALFPHMTAFKNIAFPLRMRGIPKHVIKTRVDEALDLVGLRRFADKYPREMSGGQQQRVALARGLVFNPGVLLLDEPLGALDKNLREQMQIEIKRIHREVGITMIYVTHDQTEAMTMSDRVAVFSNGKIAQIAPPLEIYNFPDNRFVAEFIGDSNLLEGRLHPTRAGWMEVAGLGAIRLTPGAERGVPRDEAFDLLVRPERVRILNGVEPGDRNAVVLTVQTIINYGDSALVIGSVADRAFRMRLAGSLPPGLAEGEQISVGWDSSDSHIILRR